MMMILYLIMNSQPHIQFKPNTPPTLKMRGFFVAPEGVRVEKGLATKGAYQPHPQVDSPNVSHYGGS